MQAEVSTSDADEEVLTSDLQATQRTRETTAAVEGEDLQSVTVTLNNDAVRVFNRFADIFIIRFRIFAGLGLADLFLFTLAVISVAKA